MSKMQQELEYNPKYNAHDDANGVFYKTTEEFLSLLYRYKQNELSRAFTNKHSVRSRYKILNHVIKYGDALVICISKAYGHKRLQQLNVRHTRSVAE